jgi:PEP-CTERM motif
VDSIRLGGPSSLSSGGGGGNFDNVSLEVIPEPATLGLMGLGGLAMLGRKRR